MMVNCRGCHESEYAQWLSGGHSATYAAIFLNKKHNSSEQLCPDCLRCHGMFYDGTIGDLVSPINTTGPWSLKPAGQSNLRVIPCLACHQIHQKGSPAVAPNYSEPDSIFFAAFQDSTNVYFYDRYEKNYISGPELPRPAIFIGKRMLKSSDDPAQRICVQCHASGAFHVAGTGDDRTPRGVHEGIPCLGCHDGHSNDARGSCKNCHPAIQDCGVDVTRMNTTFLDSRSPHDIHFVGCTDCHLKGIPKKKA